MLPAKIQENINQNRNGNIFIIAIHKLIKQMHKSHEQNSTKNQYKALYQLTRKKRANNATQEQSQQLNAEDSLQKYTALSRSSNQKKKQTHHPIKLSKKTHHNRSNSCPFMNPPDIPIRSIKIVEDESRRTLKKTSAKQNVPKHRKQRNMWQHQNNTHQRKNHIPLQHKYSGSQISQQTNTVVVHPLPIQQLSSMLYSLNHEKDHEAQFQKKQSKKQQEHKGKFHKKYCAGVSNSCKYPKTQEQFHKNYETPSFTQDNKYMLSLHHDLYFKTKLHHQIKMYDLNEDMLNLKKQTQNVKVRQEVLQKLAQKFDDCSLEGLINDGSNSYQFDEDSLLIH